MYRYLPLEHQLLPIPQGPGEIEDIALGQEWVGVAPVVLVLTAADLGLAAVPVGAFDDGELQVLLGAGVAPLVLIPVGPSP